MAVDVAIELPPGVLLAPLSYPLTYSALLRMCELLDMLSEKKSWAIVLDIDGSKPITNSDVGAIELAISRINKLKRMTLVVANSVANENILAKMELPSPPNKFRVVPKLTQKDLQMLEAEYVNF